jgi:DNA repair/transcription protein MET18/MMS19
VHLYSITLWDALKFEILNVQEEDLAEESLKALKAIATQLSSGTHSGPLQNYLNPVIKECNEHLEDTPTKQSTAAGRMLSVISEASLEASDMLGKSCLPQLFVLMKTADNLPRRRGFMEILDQLLQANLSTYGPWRKPNFTGDAIPQKPLRPSENPFSDFRTESIDA